MIAIPQVRFIEFLHDIEPSDTTKSSASSAHTDLRSFLRGHDVFQDYWLNDFLSGSYKRDTSIRPRSINGEIVRPDVDIIVVTNHSSTDNPKDVVDLLYTSLQEEYSDICRQTRSVGIKYYKANMDVVPVIPNGNIYLIPDCKQESWVPTNPSGHTKWTTEINDKAGGRFKPLVKLMKWWRRENPTIAKKPKGFVLECITAECMDFQETYYGELFVKTLETIVSKYGFYVSLGQVPPINDPSVPGNLVTDGITPDAFSGFYNKVKAHADIGRKALNHTDPEKATEFWRIIFGDRFPKTVVEKNNELTPTAVNTSQFSFPNKPVVPNKPKGFA